MEHKKEIENNAESVMCVEKKKSQTKKSWQKPKIEDVSGKVMAQPYIRFT